ncbi:MAG: restriction endonuclease [Bacteroidales bacterium]|nr:restriction endonuclease [Bacteroidales bacterium]
MSEITDITIQAVKTSKTSFCRFITGNDAGSTGSHQSGFYIPKCAAPLLFGKECSRGENQEKRVTIKWQNNIETNSRFIYYGQGTRNEYRITRFGKDFEFLMDKYVGSLLVIAEQENDYYLAFVLESDDDIENFLSYFNLSTEQTNQLINVEQFQSDDEKTKQAIADAINNLYEFPQTLEMGRMAQRIFNDIHKITDNNVCDSPDTILFDWRKVESDLFFALEDKLYRGIYSKPFANCNDLMVFANTVLNRRKSRAGKSLEHHLSAIFTANGLVFEEQANTENNKMPDFLFPNSECYHNFEFPADDITVLGAKTTCKDRWRQVINEADRVDIKYLCTLQQGISRAQLKEMEDSNVKLVVPNSLISSYPIEYRNKISNIKTFISMVKEKQNRIPKHFLIKNSL